MGGEEERGPLAAESSRVSGERLRREQRAVENENYSQQTTLSAGLVQNVSCPNLMSSFQVDPGDNPRGKKRLSE